MIQALERYVSQEEKQEAIRQECIKAHDEYKLTGLHVADEEIDDGVDQLLDGKKMRVPACHV